MKVIDALGKSRRTETSDMPPSTAITCSIRDVTEGNGFWLCSKAPISGSDGIVQPEMNSWTSALFKISECAILLALSNGLRPLNCEYPKSNYLFGGEAVNLNGYDEGI